MNEAGMIWESTGSNRGNLNLPLSHRAWYYRIRDDSAHYWESQVAGVTPLFWQNSRFAIPITHIPLWGTPHDRRCDSSIRWADSDPIPYQHGEEPIITFECFHTLFQRLLKAWTYLIAHPCPGWPDPVQRRPPSSYMHANSHPWISDSPCSRVLGVIIPRIH